jgi:ATP-dependent protease HslVU (ClpYQ) peptidase subunit
MTCVIGYKTDAGIWLGADSAGSNEYGQQQLRADTKVFRRGPMTFAFCGSFRMGQLLRFGLDRIEQPAGMHDFEFMCTRFIDDVRATLRHGGFTHIKDNEESGGYFIVAYRDQLYYIEADFQVGVTMSPFMCMGSGEDLATGAMTILDSLEWAPPKAIRRALQVAADNNSFVAPPFVVVKHRP